jgi:signal transduction histidine kinase
VSRLLLTVVVVVADTALLVAGHQGDLPLWVAPAYALTVALVIALGHRAPMAALVVVLMLASLTGGSYVLLLWGSYQGGRVIVTRWGTAKVVGAALGGLAVQIAIHPADPKAIPTVVTTYVVFVALPLLVGRYLAQHQRLVSALDQHNRQLRRERELLAEQERLRERLRIARDVHDSLGHRLSLVSVQAAALEVSPLPPQQRQAILQLAGTARDAMNELHELVGTLRGTEEADAHAPGIEAIRDVVAEFSAAGMPVTLRQCGEPRPLSTAAGQAAYRVIQEGLTNAAKHAAGRPVTVSVEWEPDALLVAVIDRESAAGPAAPGDPAATHDTGHGLTGLSERVRLAGGFLDRKPSHGEHRLIAMLPVAAEPTTDDDDLPATGRIRTVALGFAVAALVFLVLPAMMLTGVR